MPLYRLGISTDVRPCSPIVGYQSNGVGDRGLGKGLNLDMTVAVAVTTHAVAAKNGKMPLGPPESSVLSIA